MSLYIHCDECGAAQRYNDANPEGWLIGAVVDYCPRCAHRRNAPPVGKDWTMDQRECLAAQLHILRAIVMNLARTPTTEDCVRALKTIEMELLGVPESELPAAHRVEPHASDTVKT